MQAADNDRRLTRLLAKARLKYGQACLENLDTRAAAASTLDSSPAWATANGSNAGNRCSSPVRPASAKPGWPVRWLKRRAASVAALLMRGCHAY
jgi:hypothetical protein